MKSWWQHIKCSMIFLYDSKGVIVSQQPMRIILSLKKKPFGLRTAFLWRLSFSPSHVVGEDGLHLKVYILNIASTVESFVLRARLKFDPMWDLIDGIDRERELFCWTKRKVKPEEIRK